MACHKVLANYRVCGEWFRVSYSEAIQCILRTMTEVASDELEREEAARLNGFSDFCVSYFKEVRKLEEIKLGMLKAEWTYEAINFCFELGYEYFSRIYDELFMSPAVTLIGTDKIWICYPEGFECHDKEEYILKYDKNAIAKDIGCSVDDVPEWDDYSVIIEEQHRLAA